MKIGLNLLAIKYGTMYKFCNRLYKNNAAVNAYKEEGLNLMRGKVENLPLNIAFLPKFMKQSFCVKIFDKIYMFVSNSNLKKPQEEKFDSFLHESGHYLHFQNMPSIEERMDIWEKADKEKIKTSVSEYSVKKKDGREFVPEVFKFLIKGKTFDDYIMNIYQSLKGPGVKM